MLSNVNLLPLSFFLLFIVKEISVKKLYFYFNINYNYDLKIFLIFIFQ
jgi:hypothetical protein